ncbi:universal stress protein [Paracoccus stylophorae]|uniref:Universal stress protein n=1 Tax=Paracoccus stylophorae TaxID=659350 RepID=A0ABY7SYX3_9RHOB|nr:universal stress protein [Paracoccus stylophorae]WCR11547.1 universal stress protein [Paracoccus stylophorae]
MSSETVLVPIDVSVDHDRSRMFDEVAGSAARGARVVLMTVVPEVYLPTTTDAKGMIRAMMDHAATRLADVAASAPFDVDQQIVRYGPVAPGIIDVAAEIDATLIVINARSREKAAYLLGSVASRVANHARCSVHVVRA